MCHRGNKTLAGFAALALMAVLAMPSVAVAESQAVPPELSDLQNAAGEPESATPGLEIRRDAMREAALSYGARGGLAHRTWEIRRQLAQHEGVLSRLYDFRRLLIAAPNGMTLEPPVISEQQNALIVEKNGQQAATAERVYNINMPAKIVTAPRDWRMYLERDWGEVTPPPSILLPRTSDERADWKTWVGEGWKEGIRQADDIFQADLDRMVRDFAGMVRYRNLLAQGMVSAPYAMGENRGITGGGDEMRVGDRAVTITGPSQLQTKASAWNPADR